MKADNSASALQMATCSTIRIFYLQSIAASRQSNAGFNECGGYRSDVASRLAVAATQAKTRASRLVRGILKSLS